MASDNHAPSRRPLDLHFHAATGLVPFGQNRSLICQLCPLGNRGAQPQSLFTPNPRLSPH